MTTPEPHAGPSTGPATRPAGSRGVPWRPPPMTAWEQLLAGNRRFLEGRPAHPGQDADRRAEVAAGQRPRAVVFGCSDSRVAAELIFDQGLGDLFVVRTAGHTVDVSVLGSLEFGVGALDIPLVVVLGHDSCGAVAATLAALRTGNVPGGFVRDVVERVTPSVLAARRHHPDPSPSDVEAEHVRQTAALLCSRSRSINTAVRLGRCVVVSATYTLIDGEVRALTTTRPD